MKKKVETITRGEINFWYPFALAVITIVIWGVRLEGKVNANDVHSRESSIILKDVQDRVIRIEKDIEFIRLELGGR